MDASYSAGSTELFNAYKAYCEECGMKPYAQKNFVQQITTAYPAIERGIDSLGKRRVLNGIRVCDLPG
jgi:putative DNA primase/helicase